MKFFSEIMKAGAHIGAMPFQVLDMLFNHPLREQPVLSSR
jgi:hypothetical protein